MLYSRLKQGVDGSADMAERLRSRNMRYRYVNAIGTRSISDVVVNSCIGFRIWKHIDKRGQYRNARAFLGQLYSTVETFDEFVFNLCIQLCENASDNMVSPSIADDNVGLSSCEDGALDLSSRGHTELEVRAIVAAIPVRNRLKYFADGPGNSLRQDGSLLHQSKPMINENGRVQLRCLVCHQNTSRACSVCTVPLHERIRQDDNTKAASCHNAFHSLEDLRTLTGSADKKERQTKYRARGEPHCHASQGSTKRGDESESVSQIVSSPTVPQGSKQRESVAATQIRTRDSATVPAAVELFGQRVTVEDAERVKPIDEHEMADVRFNAKEKFLNDKLLNMLLQKALERYHATDVKYVNTYFMSIFERHVKEFGAETAYRNRQNQLRKWNVNLTKTPKIFFPINIKDHHWFAAIVLNTRSCNGKTMDRSLLILDSVLNSPRQSYISLIRDLYDAAGATIEKECYARCAIQNNSYDCGLHVAHYFEMLASGKLDVACGAPDSISSRKFNTMMRECLPDMTEMRRNTYDMIMNAMSLKS
eukprot:m.1643022 g.1643022  ORF g.1643022 m.1643022 type:complete len:535 (-) comp56510_c0_seq1:30-1634(-)